MTMHEEGSPGRQRGESKQATTRGICGKCHGFIEIGQQFRWAGGSPAQAVHANCDEAKREKAKR